MESNNPEAHGSDKVPDGHGVIGVCGLCGKHTVTVALDWAGGVPLPQCHTCGTVKEALTDEQQAEVRRIYGIA